MQEDCGCRMQLWSSIWRKSKGRPDNVDNVERNERQYIHIDTIGKDGFVSVIISENENVLDIILYDIEGTLLGHIDPSRAEEFLGAENPGEFAEVCAGCALGLNR